MKHSPPASELLFCVALPGLLFGQLMAIVSENDMKTYTMKPTVVTSNATLTEATSDEHLFCQQVKSVCLNITGVMNCYQYLHEHACYLDFQLQMATFNHTGQCTWNEVKSFYNAFTLCTERIAECLRIPWPNPMVEEVFVEIHTSYFQTCITEELKDPDPSIVFALAMTPICLIPAMVLLVVLKTKNGDGRS